MIRQAEIAARMAAEFQGDHLSSTDILNEHVTGERELAEVQFAIKPPGVYDISCSFSDRLLHC